MRGGVATPRAVGVTSTAPSRTERHERGGDRSRGRVHARDRQHGGGEVAPRLEIDADELGELFVVRLDQVGRCVLGRRRARAGPDVSTAIRGADAPQRSAHGADDVDVEAVACARAAVIRRARASLRRRCASTTAAISSATSVGDEGRARQVELGRHAAGSVIVRFARTCPVNGNGPCGHARRARARRRTGSSSAERQDGDRRRRRPRRRPARR